jgi:hypothetical protein
MPAEIPATVYDFYKEGTVFNDFGVASDDTYEEALHKCEEDIEDDAAFLMKKLGLKAAALGGGSAMEPRGLKLPRKIGVDTKVFP